MESRNYKVVNAMRIIVEFLNEKKKDYLVIGGCAVFLYTNMCEEEYKGKIDDVDILHNGNIEIGEILDYLKSKNIKYRRGDPFWDEKDIYIDINDTYIPIHILSYNTPACRHKDVFKYVMEHPNIIHFKDTPVNIPYIDDLIKLKEICIKERGSEEKRKIDEEDIDVLKRIKIKYGDKL